MKKGLSYFLIIVYIYFFTFPLDAFGFGSGSNTDDYRFIDDLKSLEYSTSAPAGKTVKYRTVGFTLYFYSNTLKDTNGDPFKYTTTLAFESSMLYEVISSSTAYDKWTVPFLYGPNPLDANKNTVISRFLKTYESNTSRKNDIINFFSKGSNTIYLSHVFTVVENGIPQGSFSPNGSYTGEVYFKEPDIKAARPWRTATMQALGQYYNIPFPFPSIPVTYAPPTPVISRDRPTSGNIIAVSTNFNINNDITLYADRSSWPSCAIDKYYKWEYKKTSDMVYPALALLTGKGKASVTFPKLDAGSYNVKLTEWYSTSDGMLQTDKSASTSIIMYIDDAGVIITPTVDDDKIITQAQIDANATISVNVSGLAELMNFEDTTKISKWAIHMRKEPAEGDYQYQAFTFTTNLGTRQSASKVFTIPASVLKNSDSYTQQFALKAVATVNGNDVSSSLVYCSINLIKRTNKPVAILDAPSSTQAGQLIILSGQKSYSPNGSIVSYHIEIPELGWSTDKASDQSLLPYGKTSYDAVLTITDNLGLQASDTKTITVAAPTPIPMISSSGKLKKNRIAYFTIDDILDKAGVPHTYGVDYSKTKWSIKPVSGTGAMNEIDVITHVDSDPLKVTGDPYSASLLDGKRTIPIAFSSPGQYDVTGILVNSLGISGTITTRYTIVDDLPPAGKTVTLDTVNRDTLINGAYYAILKISDETYSPDGDFIEYRKIRVTYDANNNGIFGDIGDITIIVDESSDPTYIENNRVFSVPVLDVGKYQTNIYVREGYIP